MYSKMDLDLFADLLTHLPEKYFLSKTLTRKNALSFVDYERGYYRLNYQKEQTYDIFYWSRLNGVIIQEIGFSHITLYYNGEMIVYFSRISGATKSRYFLDAHSAEYQKYKRIFESYMSVGHLAISR